MNSLIPGIVIQDANLAYQNKILFQNLQFYLEAGRFTCILGPSGIGKSSLLRMIAGLEEMGTCPSVVTTRPLCKNFRERSVLSAAWTNILLKKRSIYQYVSILKQDFRSRCAKYGRSPLRSEQLHSANAIQATDKQPLQGRIAYMSQSDALMPWLSVLDNVLLGYRLRGENSAAIKTKAIALLERVGLSRVLHARPESLSGGMRQRTALVRTLLEDKPIVLMDEPFSALDSVTRLQLQDIMVKLLSGRTVLFITHDPLEALRIGHVIYIMSGQPAVLERAAAPEDEPPRAMGNPVLLAEEAALFKKLMAAREGL